jgi:hypothetical protein
MGVLIAHTAQANVGTHMATAREIMTAGLNAARNSTDLAWLPGRGRAPEASARRPGSLTL